MSTTSKKKPTGKAVVRDPPIEEEPTFGEQPEPLSSAELTPELRMQPSAQEGDNPTQNPEFQSQLTQRVSNTLGVPVQLTDKQVQFLLKRLTSVDASGSPTPPTVQEALSTQHPHRTQGDEGGDLENDLSDGTSQRSGSRRLPGISLQSGKRSPKHDDPDKLDDGTSPTYASWCILLEGKLLANADWWTTEQGRINYVFSRTTGKAQGHLEPRMSRMSANRWTTVDEMLDHLDIIFRDHFKKEKALDQYARLTQQLNEDFNEFHSEFARLAALGEISPEIWRADLYRKLNRTFQDRLLSTEH